MLRTYPARRKLMGDERSPLQEIASEKADEESALEPYLISTYPADFTLEVLVGKWNRREIRKEGFQRHYVWTKERASKLIESFLLGLPVPPVYLYKDKTDGGLLVVDGHQRLRTIVYFFSGWFGDKEEMPEKDIVPFELVGLHEKSPFLNETYESLKHGKYFNELNSSVLRSFIMQQIAPDDDTSMFEVFSRLNTGGMVLLPQEIRNCVCDGEFNNLLKELNANDDWRSIFGVKKEDKRMRDVELILRFLALYFDKKKYRKPMKDYLNNFMQENRRPPQVSENDDSAKTKEIEKRRKAFFDRQEEFSSRFQRTARLVVECLGVRPFNVKRGLNAAVFDSVFTAFARHFSDLDAPAPTPEAINEIKNRYNKLLKDEEFLNWITAATTDDEVVPKRINKAQTILFN